MLASPLASRAASIFRARDAGTRAFKMRFIRPGTTLERFLSRTAEALRYALLDAHRFHRHGLRIEAELFEHRCVRKPGCQYCDVDTQRFELMLKRFAEAMYIRLRASVIRHIGNAVFRTHCPHEDDSAPAPLGEFRAEMVSNIQMGHRVEPQRLLEQLTIELQELARISGASIGDDKPDVDIVSSAGEFRYDSLLWG